MTNIEMIQEKIGEAIGLEKAAHSRGIGFTWSIETRTNEEIIENEGRS